MDQARATLSPSDALLWRIEADPVLRSPIVVVGLLDSQPPWAGVRAGMDAAVGAVDRFRQRIVDGGPLGRPCWEPDPSFSLDHHLQHVIVADGGDLDAVLRLAEPQAAAAFDPARPAWSFTLVDGLDGGRSAFVLRFHHAISDGVGAIGLADHVFDRSRRPRRTGTRRTRRAAPAPAPAPPRSPLGLAADATRQAARLAADPVGTTRGAARFARSASRLLATAPAPLSPLLVGRGLDRTLHVLDVPLDGLRRAAGVVDGTVNDVWLAAVGGAVHRYHEALGVPVAALRFTVPISLRAPGDDAGGNRFSPARFVVPVDDPDPARRAQQAGTLVRQWRAEPALRATASLAAVLDRLPTPVLTRLFGGMLRAVDVDAVDVPGLERAAYLGGAEVERLWAFAPLAGSALSTTLVSHHDVACVGLQCDRAAVSDPDLLARCLDSALREVLALVPEAVHR